MGRKRVDVVCRIGISALDSSGGSIELPPKITLCCPNCGKEAMDKGLCSVQMIKIPVEGEMLLSLETECYGCSTFEDAPAITQESVEWLSNHPVPIELSCQVGAVWCRQCRQSAYAKETTSHLFLVSFHDQKSKTGHLAQIFFAKCPSGCSPAKPGITYK